MVDVFISYARESQAHAQRIAEAAAREGYSVWWDEELPPHLAYGDVITEKIGAAKAVIVIWSAAAAESEWVRAEADLARTEKKLIQTSVDGRLPPMPFNQIQFAPIGDWQGEPDHPGWKKVRSSLAALCGGSAGSAAGTEPMRAWSAPPSASVTGPTSVRSGRPGLLPIVLAGAAMLLAGGGGWLWMQSGAEGEPEGSGNEAAASAVRPAPAASGSAASVGRPRPATASFTQAAVIDDPDGFTNVRSGPSSSFPVVARVNRGEVFTTYAQDGEWWQVRTADSRVGFMARSRIRVIEPDMAASAAETAPALADAGLVPAAARAAEADDPPQIFPDSSRRRLRPADLAGLSAAQLRLARNEIFARHGRPFRDPALRRHFELYAWYVPRPGPIALTPVEQANVRLLQQAERK